MVITETDALIVVDVQNDFCPGGALPVPGGDAVVRAINKLIHRVSFVVYARDWHPRDHCSFSDAPEFKDGSWPAHCVQNSPGAEFHGSLMVPLDAHIVSKGAAPGVECYSAFAGTGLEDELRRRGVARVLVAGLATDYCVQFTVLDARKAGFDVVLIEDGCRGVAEDTTAAALDAMREAGAAFCRSSELVS